MSVGEDFFFPGHTQMEQYCESDYPHFHFLFSLCIWSDLSRNVASEIFQCVHGESASWSKFEDNEDISTPA